MIPILFEQYETSFMSNGIGRLSDVLECTVSERLNDFYTLSMQYPADGAWANRISVGKLILATPADGERPQPFRIYEIDKSLNGIFAISASHISYDLSGYPVRGITATSAATAVAALSSRAIIPSGFTFSTDLTVNANWSIAGACSIRAAMGGEDGLLGIYGGEWYYDRYSVRLMAQRGNDRGVEIRYGKNITDLDAIENSEETYTGAFAFYLSGTYVGSNIIYSDQYAVPQKILITDHTSDFQSAPTTSQLNDLATADLKAANGIKSTLTVSFVPTDEHIRLGDLVTVIYNKYGIRKKLEVVQTDYNVLLDRYNSLEIGAIIPTLADTIASL